MVDFNTMIKAAKVKWIKKYLDGKESDWKYTFEQLCNKENLNILLQTNFDMKEIPTLIPQYYRDTLEFWNQIINGNKTYQSNISQQIIWYNKNVKIGANTVYNNRLLQVGIWTGADLFDDQNKIISYKIWRERGALPQDYMLWRSIVASVKQKVKNQVIVKEIVYPFLKVKEKQINITKVTEKEIKLYYNEKEYSSLQENDFKVKQKYKEMYEDILEEDWKILYTLPRNLLRDNKIKEFQYKILFRYIGTNKLLHKMKKTDSPRCNFCGIHQESIEHLFYDCHVVKTFWLEVASRWNEVFETNINVNQKGIILGFEVSHALIQSIPISAWNIVVLYGKKFIFNNKMNENIPDKKRFMSYLRSQCQICKYKEDYSVLIDRYCEA